MGFPCGIPLNPQAELLNPHGRLKSFEEQLECLREALKPP